MKTANCRAEYETNSQGIITSPGKFEGEMIYAPYFWEKGLEGCADEDDGQVFRFKIDDQDKKLFPELGNTEMLYLTESDQGFVSCTTQP